MIRRYARLYDVHRRVVHRHSVEGRLRVLGRRLAGLPRTHDAAAEYSRLFVKRIGGGLLIQTSTLASLRLA